MTSRLKRFVMKSLGKEIQKGTPESSAPEDDNFRNKDFLLERGFRFLPDHFAETPDGIRFHVTNEEGGGTDLPVLAEIFCEGAYYFKANPSEEWIAVDLGMNIGAATLFFASKKEVTAVYSFEPFAPTYQRALENIALNPDLAAKITPYQIGLGKENKTIEIPYNLDISGDMSTTIDRLDYEERYHQKEHSIETVQVQDAAEALLPIFDKHPAARIALKIDTEGAEFDILESLEKAAVLNRVDYIMMEYHFKSPQEMEDRLLRAGFLVIYRHVYREGMQVGVMYAVNINRKK